MMFAVAGHIGRGWSSDVLATADQLKRAVGAQTRQAHFTQVVRVGVGGMGDDAVGVRAREAEHFLTDAAEPNLWLGHRERSWIEERLQSFERVVGALVGQRRAVLERSPDRSQRFDVFAHSPDRFGPRHRVTAFDVRLDLGAKAKLEPPARERGEIPGRQRGEHGAARKREHDTGAHGQPSGVFEGQQRHGQPVVQCLWNMQTVVAEGLDTFGVGDGVAQRDLVGHAGVHLHLGTRC